MIETPSLLITDDDRDFRETLGGIFAPRGFRTLLAADGEEALDVLRRERVHLVMLDMHMPRLTGLETIRRIRQLPPEMAALPCILISAALDPAIEEAARRERAYSVLSKPVRLKDITSLVQQALVQTYDWRADAS